MADAFRVRGSRPAMGSLLGITVYGAERDRCRGALEAAYAEVDRIERLLSPFLPTSELSRVNRRASLGPVKTDPELIDLLCRALVFAGVTGGAVDCTVAPLMDLWGFRAGAKRVTPPRTEQIDEALGSIGCQHIQLDPEHATVRYGTPGLKVEFGAIGKGYGVDRAIEVLKGYDVRAALVSFGSSTYALGAPPEEEGWRVAIRHPRDRGRILDVVTLKDVAMATSGDDQQGVRLGGRWYGHVMDPRTGYPVAGMVSASVIASTALEADAMSTAALVLGPGGGLDLLSARRGTEGFLVSQGPAGRFFITRTPGWRCYSAHPFSTRSLGRRRFLAGALAGLGWLLMNPGRGYAVVYLTPEEALRQLVPEAETTRQETIRLSSTQKEQVGRLLGSRIREDTYRLWIAERGGSPVARAVLLNVIGKEQPITFLVVVSPEGAVKGIDVLVYRESEGSEIRSGRFMRQFAGKTLAAPLRLGRDIQAISGATLSSRSTAHAAKKALALIEALYRNPGEGQ